MKKSQKAFVVPLFVAIVGLLVAGGGVYVYKNKKTNVSDLKKSSSKDDVVDVKQKNTTINNTPLKNPVSNQTTGWKIHTNSILGYEISYPLSYHVVGENNLLNFDDTKYERGNPNGVKIQIQQDLNTYGYDLSNTNQQEQFVAKLNSFIPGLLTSEGTTQTTIKPISLGNIKYSSKVTSGPGGTFDIYYVFAKDGKSYYKILVWGVDNDQKTVDKILSTFKVNSISDTVMKNEWGVSFSKNGNWNVVENTSGIVKLRQISGVSVGDEIDISYITGINITTTDAKFGSVTYYWDENGQKWMKFGQNDKIGSAEVSLVATTYLKYPYVAGNLPVFVGTGRWLTLIVPLSHTSFLKLNITGSGQTQPLEDLLKTIKKI